MTRPLSGTGGRLVVGAALAIQLGVLWWSLDGLFLLSVFCTVPRSSPFLWIFNALHYGYAGLLLLGLASLYWARARLPYVSLLAITMLALPIQVWLVRSGSLYCDAP